MCVCVRVCLCRCVCAHVHVCVCVYKMGYKHHISYLNSNDLEIHILHVLQFLLCIFQRNTQQHTDALSNGTYLLSSN